MRDIMSTERFDRIVAAAGDNGFDADDIAWLLRHAQGEVLVVRPAVASGVTRAFAPSTPAAARAIEASAAHLRTTQTA